MSFDQDPNEQANISGADLAIMVDEISLLKNTNAELLASLIEARHALQLANDTPNGPITDTIWMMHRPETLFDFMDAMIAKVTGEQP